MSLLHLFKLLLKNIKWLVLIPIVMAASIYFFTKSEKKVFSSETVIYTGIASGYSLNGNTKADYFATSNAFDNLLTLILSRATKQEVAIDLLATHLLLKEHNPTLLSWQSYKQLQQLIPDSIKKKLVKNTLDATATSITNYMQADDKNLVYKIINSDNEFYSVNTLQNIKALRVSSSDLIRITYETNDAAICKNTLDLLINVFMKKHRLLKEGQTESVITYFNKQTNAAYQKLDSIENVFLEFNKRNDIINYYEQTKAVANEKENLDAQNHGLEMERMANKSTLGKVNDNIKGRVFQILYGNDVVKDRERLSDIYTKIALSEVVDKNNDANKVRTIDSLKNLSGAIEDKLKGTLTKLYTETNTPNGIPTKSVLDEWLKSTLSLEQSNARLTVMDKRKKVFVDEYHRFAPLGAMLKKVERQISVAEQEYLELLHGLSLANLAQQNNELTSKLTLVDAPYLPVKANPSKRAMQIIIGFMAGFIIVLAFIITSSLVNKTVQQPVKASKKIGLPLLGIYPLLNNNPRYIAKANLRLMQQLLSTINIKESLITIGVISTQKQEGKSTIIEMWQQQLEALGYNVEKKNWERDKLLTAKTNTKFLIIEFAALDEIIILPDTIPDLQHVFLVCRANRVWTKIDEQTLDIFSKNYPHPISAILNGVEGDFAEEYIGEMPKKRNTLRSRFKRWIKFEFGNKKIIG